MAVARRLRKSDLKGQLEISQKELAKQQRSIEKQLKQKGRAGPGTGAGRDLAGRTGQSARTESGRYHRAAERLAAARKKPSLAELRGEEESRKRPAWR